MNPPKTAQSIFNLESTQSVCAMHQVLLPERKIPQPTAMIILRPNNSAQWIELNGRAHL